MDVVIRQVKTCKCKREVISVAGTCSQCIKEGSLAFWELCDGKITYTEFIMRLERKGNS